MLELLKRSRRLNAQLADEGPAGLLVRLKSLSLAPGAVESEDELGTKTLPERILVGKLLQLADQLVVDPEREICVDSLVERHEPELREATARGRGKRGVELSKWRTTPECQRVSIGLGGPGQPISMKLLGSLGEHRFESMQVECSWRELEHVSSFARLDHLTASGRFELAAELHHALLKCPEPGAWRVDPEVGDQRGRVDYAIRVEKQAHEQRPLPCTRDLDRAV